MLFILFNVINNTHIPVGIFTSVDGVHEAFNSTCNNQTHYIACYPINTIISDSVRDKVAERFVIENLAKKENDSHEYASWYVPASESETNHDRSEVEA